MGHVLGSLPLGDLHLLAGDAGPGQRGAQEVAVLVQSAGLDGRPDELLQKLLADVLDEHLRGQEPVGGRLSEAGANQRAERRGPQLISRAPAAAYAPWQAARPRFLPPLWQTSLINPSTHRPSLSPALRADIANRSGYTIQLKLDVVLKTLPAQHSGPERKLSRH